MTVEEKRKKLREEKKKVTDKSLFTSPRYRSGLEKTAKAVTGRNVRVEVGYDEGDGADVGFTDGSGIYVNAANPLTRGLATRELKAASVVGILGHECGHVIHSDFWLREKYLEGFENKRIYPYAPEPEDEGERSALSEMRELVEAGDETAVRVIAENAAWINNALEDVYVEMRMCEDYPGSIRKGIALNGICMADRFPTVNEEIRAKDYGLSIITNLILQYARSGGVNNWDGYEGEYLDVLAECAETIDESVTSSDASQRFHATNRILLKIWGYVREFIEKAEKTDELEKMMKEMSKQVRSKPESGRGKADGSGRRLPKDWDAGGDESKGKGKKPGGGGGEGKKEEEKKGKPSPNAGSEESGEGAATEGEGKEDGKGETASRERLDGFRKHVKVEKEEGGRLNLESLCEDADGEGCTLTDHGYGGSGYEGGLEDVNRILSEMAEARVAESEEKAIVSRLEGDLSSIDFGSVHKKCDKTIHRMVQVPPKCEQDYKMVVPSVTKYVNRLVEGFRDLLKNKEPQTVKGMLTGRRIDQTTLYRSDGRIFKRKMLPDEGMDLAVCLLVDESGSMRSADRITHARLASLTLYLFCQRMEVPIMVYGHSTGMGNISEVVDLYSYAEFESIDGKDGYRIMDMSARRSNRDGAALRFAGERLIKRGESVKILILISDGQPAAFGYSGALAEQDLRNIKKELNKKGVTLFAAAIGDDRETIERIYGDGYLDISNLEKLPIKLTKLVSKYIR